MYVCMHVYVCTYVCVYVRVCMYVCVYIYVCMRVWRRECELGLACIIKKDSLFSFKITK